MSATWPTYDFDLEAQRVCEAIGSTNGWMTVRTALTEAYQAGERTRPVPCGHRREATYGTKCQLPICAGDREASRNGPPWFCDPEGWSRLHPTTRSVFEEF